jgi:NAD(P)H-dependent FMN reductase
MTALSIKVIMGSTRQSRFSDKPARWIADEARKRPGLDVELLDLRDYPMPFYDEPKPPSAYPDGVPHPVVARWRDRILAGDGFIIATPEYNHGYPAVLKNALDYVYHAWNRKAVGFVSWGGVSGARSVEQLRLVCIELQMAPIRAAVHLRDFSTLVDEHGTFQGESVQKPAAKFLDELTWWTQALRTARDAGR